MRHRRNELLTLASTLAGLGGVAVAIGAATQSSSSPWTSTAAVIGYALLGLSAAIFLALLVEWSKVVQRLSARSRRRTAAHGPDSDAQDQPTTEQVRVLDAVANYFLQHGSCPRFKQMSTLLDREGLKLRPVAQSMPAGLLLPNVRPRGQFFRDEDELMVTLDGLLYTTDGKKLLDLMALVLAHFAERERAIVPDAAGVTPELLVYRDEVARDLDLSELELEQARQLISAYETRVWSSSGHNGNWQFVIDQEAIRDYRGISSGSDYLQAHEGTWTLPATGVPVVARSAEPDDLIRIVLTKRVLHEAITKLEHHHNVLEDWNLINSGRFDPTDRGEWETRKEVLLQDSALYDKAFRATEKAFASISLPEPTDVSNDLRMRALRHIDEALIELEGALRATP
ncbi:MAG TPA: hypothetical protein VNC40_00015 [Gaiellaceae bacterium]|nr:hypothetical protein [Gaiellaceae bacterium]